MRRDVVIPLQEPKFPVTVVYAETYHGPGTEKSNLMYLHRSRLRQISTELRDKYMRSYASDLPAFLGRFREVLREVEPPDVILRAPSSRTDNVPYFREAAAAFTDAKETIENAFSTTGDVRASEAKSLDEYLPHITPLCKFPDRIEHLLIVDDIFSGGVTASGILSILAQTSTTVGKCTVAVPLYVGPKF